MCQAEKSLADPALLVAAREDIVVPAERVVEIRDQRLVTAEVALIDGSGPSPHLEQPERLAEAVRGFLFNVGLA